MASEWKSSACILCSENCGMELQVEGRRLARIRGDRAHPLDARLPVREGPGPRLVPESLGAPAPPAPQTCPWRIRGSLLETAIAEVAQRLAGLRDTHGGQSIAFYGCALIGNQLALLHAMGFRHALRSPFLYHALGQEKTGDFWLNGEMFGSQACHTTTNDLENADFVLFTGTNPWQATASRARAKIVKGDRAGRAPYPGRDRSPAHRDGRPGRRAPGLCGGHGRLPPGGDTRDHASGTGSRTAASSPADNTASSACG